MMSFNISQASTFLDSLLFGVIILFFYDSLRIFRRICFHNMTVMSIEDFIFWSIATGCFFVFIYRENNGEIRFYILFGIITGMALYELLIGHILVEKISLMIKKCVNYLAKALNFILKPFRIFLSRIKRWVLLWIKEIIEKIKVQLHHGQAQEEEKD